MIYLDSCAVIKLIVDEPDSPALEAHLESSEDTWVSSEIVVVEVHRALHRLQLRAQAKEISNLLLGDLTLLGVGKILTAASDLEGQHLRSLDALHLATAVSLKPQLHEFVTYDKRLAEAAADAGFIVTSPSNS
jgi:predicted nucleic acid-binding protein